MPHVAGSREAERLETFSPAQIGWPSVVQTGHVVVTHPNDLAKRSEGCEGWRGTASQSAGEPSGQRVSYDGAADRMTAGRRRAVDAGGEPSVGERGGRSTARRGTRRRLAR